MHMILIHEADSFLQETESVYEDILGPVDEIDSLPFIIHLTNDGIASFYFPNNTLAAVIPPDTQGRHMPL